MGSADNASSRMHSAHAPFPILEVVKLGIFRSMLKDVADDSGKTEPKLVKLWA